MSDPTGHEPPLKDETLDRLFADVAGQRAAPSPDFLARLQAQAAALQPAPGAIAPPPGRVGWRASLGGWLGLGGLATAAMAGVWIGIAPPDMLIPYIGGTTTVDLLPDTLSIFEEG